MANTIIPKRSSVGGKVPLASDLQIGEVAFNLADGKIFSKNAGGDVIEMGGGSGSGGNYQSAETVSGSFTLAASDAGRAYVCSLATAITITLPLIADTAVGASFLIINTGTANVTVQRAGTDTIDAGPSAVTSIVVSPNTSLQLIRASGSSLWHVVNPAITIATQAQAQAGTDNTTLMTPLRVAEAVAVQSIATIAGASAGGVGTYAFCVSTTSVTAGATVAGSNLRLSDSRDTAGSSRSGTWRNMGQTVAANAAATLFLRIS